MEFAELSVFVADLSPIQDRAPQQLKTLNLIIVTFSCLVTAPVLSPRPKDPCCANPGFVQRVFLCTSVVQQLESKPTRACTLLSLDHLRGSCAGDCLIDLDHVSGKALPYSGACTFWENTEALFSWIATYCSPPVQKMQQGPGLQHQAQVLSHTCPSSSRPRETLL